MFFHLNFSWKKVWFLFGGLAEKAVREIISRWAPPNDGNNTRGYIRKVCDLSGLRETDIIVAEPSDGDPYNIVTLVWAMAIVENGDRWKNLIDRGEICRGYEMAFNE